MASDCVTTGPTKASTAARVSLPTLLLGLLLAGWLVVQLPAFLCMGLYDPSIYDVLARRVLKGDVLYQDLLETNFPGIVWAHMTVRTLFGWSTEALRAVDVVLVGTSVVLLLGWLPRSMQAGGRIGVAAALLAFYFSTTEWCHCQRDVWMLPVCLVGLNLRCRQAELLMRAESPFRLLSWALLEGAVWSSACWIKPFVALPGLACWLVTAWHATITPGATRRLAADLAGLLAGGLAVGGLGAAWLVATGAWGAFLDVMFDWNRDYFASNMCGASPASAVLTFVSRFFPWFLVHVVAVPVAVMALLAQRGVGTPSALQAGFYLAWLMQSFLFQHFFDYVHVPSIFMGIVLLASYAHPRMKTPTGLMIVAFLVLGVLWHGVRLTADRAAVWAECMREGSTPEMKCRAAVQGVTPWPDLAFTAEFLRSRNVRDGEVTCFSDGTISLYNDLDIRPTTRFLIFDVHLGIFFNRRDVILSSLAQSPQRYFVCDVTRGHMKRLAAVLDDDSASSPNAALRERVVFRSGNVVVFRLDGSEVPRWLHVLVP